ncbi:uncharacterized protein LOC136040575 isoform X2 [Artemia franciscana]|uniref:uncharacterized protein LOC136040575 isoform X2 n=1 Tax=Artemia franciscana TaxID=6661 RepID=UPI0032DAD0B0
MTESLAMFRQSAEAAGNYLMSLTQQRDCKMNYDCPTNCSVHGECFGGRCICEVQFDGDSCTEPNIMYHIGFSCVFFLIALATLIQLIICISSEYKRQKVRACLGVFQLTPQKFLYFFAFLGSVFKAIYFMKPDADQDAWASSLLRASYPVILTCISLIVCFWAEVFHVGLMGPPSASKFLSKSLVGFLVFNFVLYSVLASEFVFTYAVAADNEERQYYTNIYNMCYAFLFLVAVTFFLVYGVEVFFKAKVSGNASTDLDYVDRGQLVQSRLGLISQAFMVLLAVSLLMSDTLGELWRDKVGLFSRNTHDLVFRIAEIGVVLWFPCVLWNCMRPEELWILNPRRLLKDFVTKRKIEIIPSEPRPASPAVSSHCSCWICYDSDVPEKLISPCACKGDTSLVHHDCLRRWLVESSGNEDVMFCKICLTQYVVATVSFKDIPWSVALTPRHCLKTGSILVVISGVAVGAWAITKNFPDARIRMLVAGVALILEYVLARYIAISTIDLFQRSKMSAIQIVGNPVKKEKDNTDFQSLASHCDVLIDS